MELFDVYSLYEIEPVKGEGSYVFTADGTRYLDLYGGHAVISIGHAHPHYVDAVSRQVAALDSIPIRSKIRFRSVWPRSSAVCRAMRIIIFSCVTQERKQMRMR